MVIKFVNGIITVILALIEFIKKIRKKKDIKPFDPCLIKLKDLILLTMSSEKLGFEDSYREQITRFYFQLAFVTVYNGCYEMTEDYMLGHQPSSQRFIDRLNNDILTGYARRAYELGIPDVVIQNLDIWNKINIEVIITVIHDMIIMDFYDAKNRYKYINVAAYLACRYIWVQAIKELKLLNNFFKEEFQKWHEGNRDAAQKLCDIDVHDFFIDKI